VFFHTYDGVFREKVDRNRTETQLEQEDRLKMFTAFTRSFIGKKKKNDVEIKKITLGICAMDKKTQSKPMREILKRLSTEQFEIVIFGDECILHQPVESWPVVEALITFYSNHFPTQKALDYVKLRKPYMINDLEMGEILKDRRKVYELLESQGIDVPLHVFCNRDDPSVINVVEEFDEYIVVNGVQINKPLVEKPIDAENHNIYIYYPMSAGGGSKRLFRKVDDRSSEFYPKVNEVRQSGSYIYESFVVTQGTDVKVYTVGPDYGHAEARKSPVVDGKVNRDSAGLEVRYPVILSPSEKEIARKIVTAFKQTVCGFDILRVQGKSYCCDVNGFSFVKNSRKYYDDASQILTEIMLKALRPEFNTSNRIIPLIKPVVSKDTLKTLGKLSITDQLYAKTPPLDDRPPSPSPSMQSIDEYNVNYNTMSRPEELRCVIAVIRHGDRTPKQKMKIKVTESLYLDYFHTYTKNPTKELKVKSKSALVKFLDITRIVISSGNAPSNTELFRKLRQIRDVLERWEISGINRKLQMKPQKWEEVTLDGNPPKATEILLILKWGGDLTPLGRERAENVGENFRHLMYPDHEGGGVLRLHATYRHDLKIKASDEGRVMKTAAAFTKGLLELEGQLTPILASLVTVEEKNRQMLDKGGNFEIKVELDRCKNQLNMLQENDEIMSEEVVEKIAPGCPSAVKNAMLSLKSPLQTLKRMHTLIGQLCMQLNALCYKHGDETVLGTDGIPITTEDKSSLSVSTIVSSLPSKESISASSTISTSDSIKDISISKDSSQDGLYLQETLSLMADRWEKIFKDFYVTKTGSYDLSKVPDVYDMIRFDILHNSHLKLQGMNELFDLACAFENSVVPQEYGVDSNDKRIIGSKMCGALLEKIRHDLNSNTIVNHHEELHYQIDHTHAEDLAINSLNRVVRTRLYFTSESHLHTLLNVLRFPANGKMSCFSDEGLTNLDEITELSYLTQVIIRLFEDKLDGSFRCEVAFSPGAAYNPFGEKRNQIVPYIFLNRSISYNDMISCLNDAITAGKDPNDVSDHSNFLSAIESESLNLAIPSPPPLKRNSSICVVSGNTEASDKWEMGLSYFKKEKNKEKNKKIVTGSSGENSYNASPNISSHGF